MRQDRADNEEGMKLLRQAIALDAEFGRAHGYLAFGDCLLLFYERADNRDEVLSRGIKAANRALAIDRRDYFARHAAGRLSPNDPMAWDVFHYKASAYIRLNEFDLAIENFERVCEFPTVQFVPPATLAALCVIQGREEEGLRALDQARQLELGLTIDVMKKVYGVTKERPARGPSACWMPSAPLVSLKHN